MGLEPRKSIGTSSFVVLATSASAVCSYIYEGLTSFRAAAAIGVTAMVSARIGATMTNKVKPKTLKKGFGAWLMIVSVLIFAKAMKLLPVSWWPVLWHRQLEKPLFPNCSNKAWLCIDVSSAKMAPLFGPCGHGQMEKKSEVTSSVSHAGATAAIFPLSAVGIASGMISGLLGVAWSLEKLWQKIVTSLRTTVDGSEIRRENHRWDEKQPCK